jgi:rhodanese-related sulfurtransferase
MAGRAAPLMKLCSRRQSLQGLASAALLGPCPPVLAFWAPPAWPQLKADIRRRFPTVPQITVPALREWLRDSSRIKPLLLDVRPLEEFNDGHLPQAWRAGSVDEALTLLRKRPKDTTAVLYCSVGWRSAEMAQALMQRGVEAIQNLEGSIFEWANDGLPLQTPGSVPTHQVHPYNRKWGVLLRRELWSREL